MHKKIICAFTLATVFAMPVIAQNIASADTIVKKTEKGVCHTSESRYYKRIKHFESYKNVAECVKSGGTVATTPGMKA
jgi:hypothetical protein